MSVASYLATPDHSTTQRRAIEDAKSTQLSILRDCANDGKEPPPYELTELIGKGSFGRVYKAIASGGDRQFFAVKIISIEEGDIRQPGAADTFNDILKEVNTLKLLRNSGAKNINNIVDALLVGQSIWMITEYCAGGSVASLMRPTSGLPERWMIPILREVAEALYWVHQEGVIHRDVKCANVLVTGSGAVQLCDFGVAGIMQSKVDKRSTVTGTIQWMAPELFDPTVAYGNEIDIWAFGAMAYEMATGLPPNATRGLDISDFGSYLKSHCPRLQGDQYSSNLKDLVAFCMVEDPSERPVADKILAHPLLFDTATDYPSASLAKLVEAYKAWEAQGGSRRSLFTAGGAQGLSDISLSVLDDGWNFGTVDLSQTTVHGNGTDTIYDVYGAGVDFETPRPTARAPRRRPPPGHMKEFKVPLQMVFDPRTLSGYEDNSRAFYRRLGSSVSDLPLRDTTEDPTVRESLIDLDVSLDGLQSAPVADVGTIRCRPRSSDGAEHQRPKTQDWTFPPTAPPIVASLDGPGEGAEHNRPKTQDWTFPPIEPPTSACLQGWGEGDNHHRPQTRDWTFQLNTLGHATVDGPNAQPDSNSGFTPTAQYRSSAMSLIDLDASNSFLTSNSPGMTPQLIVRNRVSTASLIDLDAAGAPSPTHSHTTSDTASLASDAPFSLETPGSTGRLSISIQEPGIYVSEGIDGSREPSLYAPDGLGDFFPTKVQGGFPAQNGAPSPAPLGIPPPVHFPSAPAPPSADVMQGLVSHDEVRADLRRLLDSLGDHLQACNSMLDDLPRSNSSYSKGQRSIP